MKWRHRDTEEPPCLLGCRCAQCVYETAWGAVHTVLYEMIDADHDAPPWPYSGANASAAAHLAASYIAERCCDD